MVRSRALNARSVRHVVWAQIASVSLSDPITLTTSHQCYISFFDFLFALFALCPMYLLFPISCSCFPAYSYTYWHLIVFHFPFNNQDLDMRTCVCFSISVETCETFGPCPPKRNGFKNKTDSKTKWFEKRNRFWIRFENRYEFVLKTVLKPF